MVKIRVVIVDDDALVRAGLKMMLGGEASPLEVVGDVADGSEAVALVEEYRPDVVLMDIRMPKMDGIEATKRVLALPEPPKVVMLTTFNTDDLVLGALQAGAHGFLLKDTAPPDMVQSIVDVASGEHALSQQVLGAVIGAATAHPEESREANARKALAELSEREREVAIEVGRGLSNAEIAEKLYQSLTTVKATITRVLVKLGCSNRTQVAIIVHDARLLDD